MGKLYSLDISVDDNKYPVLKTRYRKSKKSEEYARRIYNIPAERKTNEPPVLKTRYRKSKKSEEYARRIYKIPAENNSRKIPSIKINNKSFFRNVVEAARSRVSDLREDKSTSNTSTDDIVETARRTISDLREDKSTSNTSTDDIINTAQGTLLYWEGANSVGDAWTDYLINMYKQVIEFFVQLSGYEEEVGKILSGNMANESIYAKLLDTLTEKRSENAMGNSDISALVTDLASQLTYIKSKIYESEIKDKIDRDKLDEILNKIEKAEEEVSFEQDTYKTFNINKKAINMLSKRLIENPEEVEEFKKSAGDSPTITDVNEYLEEVTKKPKKKPKKKNKKAINYLEQLKTAGFLDEDD